MSRSCVHRVRSVHFKLLRVTLPQAKAAEDSRTPRPCGHSGRLDLATASWSAAVLCRFYVTPSKLVETFSHTANFASLFRLPSFCFFVVFALAAEVAFASDSRRERISINDNWRFTKGDPTN